MTEIGAQLALMVLAGVIGQTLAGAVVLAVCGLTAAILATTWRKLTDDTDTM